MKCCRMQQFIRVLTFCKSTHLCVSRKKNGCTACIQKVKETNFNFLSFRQFICNVPLLVAFLNGKIAKIENIITPESNITESNLILSRSP